VPRRPPVTKTNGHNGVHSPGVYRIVLQRICEQETDRPYDVLKCDGTAAAMAALQGRHAERAAAMVEQRNGHPVHCLGFHLPPSVRERFPRGERSFVVAPDDTVTMKPLPCENS
jgi:hypothetical protein